MKIRSHRELEVYKLAFRAAERIFEISKSFPKEETYGLTSQIRRAAVSIPSNISEGAGRNSKNEFKHFLSIANGSSYELQSQLVISNRLNFLTDEATEILLTKIDEIQKMNYSFQKSLNN